MFDQALSFMTLIAHLSESGNEAKLFCRGYFGLLLMCCFCAARRDVCLVFLGASPLPLFED